MVEIKEEGLLDSKCDVIVQNCNYRGDMSEEIKGKYPDMYLEYLDICKKSGAKLLGHVHFWKDVKNSRVIANIFGKVHTGSKEDIIDKMALFKGMLTVELMSRRNKDKLIGVYYGIGCGNEVERWEDIYSMTNEIFKYSEVGCIICREM